MNKKTLAGKKAAMVIACQDFKDEEYFVPKKILAEAGAEVKTFSNKMGVTVGSGGGETLVDFLVENLNPADFEVVVFVGGSGCLPNLDNENSYRVARETVARNKILAAICIAPVILAKAGVLRGKKATVWNSPADKSDIETLEENGAVFEDKPVVQDGRIITANGPAAAQEFGETISEAL